MFLIRLLIILRLVAFFNSTTRAKRSSTFHHLKMYVIKSVTRHRTTSYTHYTTFICKHKQLQCPSENLVEHRCQSFVNISVQMSLVNISISSVLCFILLFFIVRLLSVLRGHSVFSSPPQRPTTSDFEGVSIPDFIHYIYFPILILEKEPVFSLLNVQC